MNKSIFPVINFVFSIVKSALLYVKSYRDKWKELSFIDKHSVAGNLGVLLLSCFSVVITISLGVKQSQSADKANLLQERMIWAAEQEKKREIIKRTTQEFNLYPVSPAGTGSQ